MDIAFRNNRARIAAFNMRDGYDVYPLSGLLSLINGCDENSATVICPVAFDPSLSVVWGSYQHTKLRGWSALSSRLLAEADHGAPIRGVKVGL